MGSSLRVHWMLAELALPYETKEVDLRGGEQRTPEFLAINPAGQIPVLDIDGFLLAESMAITRYLAARFKPELNGRTLEEQAKGMQWELWVSFNVQHHFGTIARQKWTGVLNPEGEAKAREVLPKYLAIFDTYLGAHPFVAGETFSTGDINASLGMSYAGFVDYDLSPYPHIQRWMQEVTSRPAYLVAKGGA